MDIPENLKVYISNYSSGKVKGRSALYTLYNNVLSNILLIS